jgi:membrane associated rhomboid family serine protease
MAATRARVCRTCGALNGDFDRCIRCGAGLSGASALADRLRGRIGGDTLLGTKVLIGLTLLVFLGQVLGEVATGGGLRIMGGSALVAYRFGALPLDDVFVREEPFRMLSAVFVHFGALHVGLNLLALMNLARAAEPGLGSARFVVSYVLSGFFSFATSAAYTVIAGGGSITGGASGAVFGVMGLILGWMVRRRDPRWRQFAVQAVLYSVVFGFAVNAAGSSILVNNSAHLGGLAAGFVLGALFASPGRPRDELGWNVAAALVLAVSVGSLALSQLSFAARAAAGGL